MPDPVAWQVAGALDHWPARSRHPWADLGIHRTSASVTTTHPASITTTHTASITTTHSTFLSYSLKLTHTQSVWKRLLTYTNC